MTPGTTSFDFRDRVIAITGGSSGIGAAVAQACRRAGATVVVLDVDPASSGGNTTPADAAQHEGTVEHVTLDVTDRDETLAAFEGIAERHGRIDGLVCAAIIQPLVDVTDIDPEVWQRTFDVNVSGVLWSCQAALRTMISQRSGSIVVFVSGVSEFGKARSAPYTMTKGAVGGFAKTLAREVAGHGVRVNLYRPGVVNTPMYQLTNLEGAGAAFLDEPEDTVGPILFLLSDQATMTGSTVAREMPYRPVKRSGT